MTVSANPNPAGQTDPVEVHLRGTWVHGCTPHFFQLVYGVSIPQPAGEPPFQHTWRVTFLEPQGGGCPSAFTNFDAQFRFASLPLGRNGIEVEVIHYADVTELHSYPGVVTVDVLGEHPTQLQLHGGRFLADATWEDFQHHTGTARVLPGPSGVSGQLWFFAPDNPELMVKVLDGCALNGHYWVLSAGATNVEYTLRVTDTLTGASWTSHNELDHYSQAGANTSAFPCE